MAITARATRIIVENGGSVDESGPHFPAGTEQVGSADRGGWGNFSYKEYMLPDGQYVCWDSEDREYQAAYRRDPATKQVIK